VIIGDVTARLRYLSQATFNINRYGIVYECLLNGQVDKSIVLKEVSTKQFALAEFLCELLVLRDDMWLHIIQP
jgi:hypothetical protein